MSALDPDEAAPPLTAATIVSTTTTTTPFNHRRHHRHERRGTNTDIASIFHLPSIFLNRRSTRENVAIQLDDDDDEDHSDYPTLLVPSTTTVSRPNNDDDDAVSGSGGISSSSSSSMTRCCWGCDFCLGRRRRRRRSNDSNRTAPFLTAGRTPTTVRMAAVAAAPGAILNLCNATLGAGILALPYTLLQAGFIYGGLLLGMAAIATERSIYILISVLHECHSITSSNNNNSNNSDGIQCSSYESLAQNVLDQAQPPSSSSSTTRKFYKMSYRRTIEIAMLLFCCGCAIGYVMAIMDILEQFHLLFVYNSRQYTMIVVWLVAMVPLSLLQSVQSLQYASAVGIMAIGTLILAAFVHYLQNHHPEQPDLQLSDSSNRSVLLLKLLSHWRTTGTWDAMMDTNTSATNHDAGNGTVSLMDFLWPANGWVSILTSGPVVLFAFSCQPNVCSIYDELTVNDYDEADENDNQRPTNNGTARTNHRSSTKKLRLMHCVTIVAVCICAVLYCSISVIALADFGKNVQPNMLSCYSRSNNNNNNSGNSTLIQIATAAMALAIVMAFPLNIFPARVTLIGLWYHYQRQRTTGSSSNGLDPSISLHVIQPHEGLTAALLDGDDVDERQMLTVNHEQESDAVTLQLDGSISARNGNYHHDMELPESGPTIAINYADHDPPFNRTVHIVSTLCLTTSTLVLAMILPNISVVFGLMGGTASSWLGFCVPGLLGIQLSKIERAHGEPPRHCLLLTSWALLIGGVIVSVLTTGVTIYNTIIQYYR